MIPRQENPPMMDVLIETTNLVGARWADWMITATVDSAALLAVVSLVWFSLRRKSIPQVGYWLFLLVPLKLLLPVSVAAPAAIARWTPSNVVSRWFKAAPNLNQLMHSPTVETQSGANSASEFERAQPTLQPAADVLPVGGEQDRTGVPAESKVPPAAPVSAPTDRAASWQGLSTSAI